MPRIHVLDEVVANKIAAGEVVERPASVLKELIENACDAGAKRIDVAIEAGGAKLCRVSDDGCGIEPDDVLLALTRHATSKLTSADQLAELQTLGFRGEALPSIASVSRFTLTSLGEGQDVGTRVTVDGGRAGEPEQVPFVRGTTIEVRDLFYNVPARRKFQKATAAETGASSSVVQRMALAQPEIHFTLTVNGRERLACTAAKTPRERIAQLFGSERAEALLEATRTDGSSHVLILAEPPERNYSNRLEQHVFVNRRAIADRGIQHALLRAYEGLLPRGRFAGAFVFLSLDPTTIDVNVHPAKTEVRFADPGSIHSLVSRAVKEALARASWVPALPATGAERVHEAVESFISQARADTPTRHYELRPATSEWRSSRGSGTARPGATPRHRTDAGRGLMERSEPLPGGRAVAGDQLAEAVIVAGVSTGCGGGAPALLRSDVGVQVLGQYRQTFIVATDDQGLLLADQHTAHERVLYERLRRREHRVEAQGLLVPQVVELPPASASLLEETLEELTQLGVDLEPMGGGSFSVRALPTDVRPEDAQSFVVDLARTVAGDGLEEGVHRRRHRVCATVACHSAVRVNMALDQARMTWILTELLRCDDPYRCPHGRQTILRMGADQIKKSFGRYW